jgi:hypothetical protein
MDKITETKGGRTREDPKSLTLLSRRHEGIIDFFMVRNKNNVVLERKTRGAAKRDGEPLVFCKDKNKNFWRQFYVVLVFPVA